jgi:hypothetical protein
VHHITNLNDVEKLGLRVDTIVGASEGDTNGASKVLQGNKYGCDRFSQFFISSLCVDFVA